MIKLAEWGELSYYMLKEVSFSDHIILVRHKDGMESQFSMETSFPIRNACTKKPLDIISERQAREFITASKNDFLEYWRKFCPLN